MKFGPKWRWLLRCRLRCWKCWVVGFVILPLLLTPAPVRAGIFDLAQRDVKPPVAASPDRRMETQSQSERDAREGALCSTSVGMVGSLDQLVLPGGELQARPFDDRRMPLVVRIVAVYPHGTDFRYDMEYFGLDPGLYDLGDYLIRKDGQAAEQLPPLPVVVTSVLPPGQVKPHELVPDIPNRWISYRWVAVVAATLWGVVLLVLVFLGRGKQTIVGEASRVRTLSDYLQPRIEAALAGTLDSSQYAELERMLIAMWRRRLKLTTVSPDQAIAQLRADPKAGPLLKQLESWMHSPNRDATVDLATLLAPYRTIGIEEFEVEHARTDDALGGRSE